MNTILQSWYDKNREKTIQLSKDIWSHPEIAMQEHYACRRVGEFLKEEGFSVQEINVQGLEEEPNCVIGRWGSGKPVIGILGEYDALPGLGQEATNHYAPLEGPGHGCGHNLISAAGAAAAAAVKTAMEAESLEGTVVFIGCPAEEAIGGKFYLARDGYFDELDVCYLWHPSARPLVIGEVGIQSIISLELYFHGQGAHAVNAEKGRSALDAAELMNIGIQYLREHVPKEVYMSHTYLSTGEKPSNIIPDYAAVQYSLRARSLAVVQNVLERVIDVAKGAALMTGTSVEHKIATVHHEYVINTALNQAVYESSLKVPMVEYTEEDYQFALELYETVNKAKPNMDDMLKNGLVPVWWAVPWKDGLLDILSHQRQEPKGELWIPGGGSDLSDVSHIVPTAYLTGPGGIYGLPGHHWSTVAVSGTSIGWKAMLMGSQVMAQASYDLLHSPETIAACRKEFLERQKITGPYQSFLKR